MNKNVFFTVLFFFLPILQKFIVIGQFQIILANLQLDFKIFVIIVAVLLAIRIVAIIYFCMAVIRWINSGFTLNELLPCIISAITIVGINYSIKVIINTNIKRVQNRIQSIPNALVRRNTTII
jgi:hypothetical protein